MMERVCEHGVGHPDPDCMYAQQDPAHGCDGCCVPKTKEGEMDNQHREIKGYRELNEEEIAAMNEVKQKGVELGELVQKLRESGEYDKRWLSIGATDLQTGLMALTRAIAKPKFFLWALVLLAGCSSGLQEKAFKDESGTYIVSRSLVNDRVTANQPHVSGVFACDSKMSAEAMAQWRQLHPGEERSEYSQCQPVEKYRPGAYQVTSDQPVGTIYKGPVESAVLGAAVGTGLALSGTDVTQQGGGASANASAKARGSRGHRR